MSYRNPQIVQPSKAGQIYAAGLAEVGKQAARGIEMYAKKQEKLLKEQEAALKKEQDLFNKVDLEKAKMNANFQQQTKKYQLSDELRPIADNAIKQYGDAKIALLTETNPQNRAYYNKLLQDSYTTLIDAEAFVGSMQADGQNYLSIQNKNELGYTKGIAGENEQERLINQEFIQVASGRQPGGTVRMVQLEDGSMDMMAYRADGSLIRSLNSVKYLQSGNSLLYDIPDTKTEFLKDVDKQILNDQGGYKEQFLNTEESITTTVGGDKYKQLYRTINKDAIVDASTATLDGQVAAYYGLDNQQKRNVWKNQLNQTSEVPLTDNEEGVRKAYTELLLDDIASQKGVIQVKGDFAIPTTKRQLVVPPKPEKETADTRKEKTRKETITTVYENIQEASPSLGISMNKAGVFTGDVELIINEDGADVINPKVEEALDRIGLETVKFIGPDDNEKITDAVKIKLAGTPDTKAIEFKKSISAQEFINKVLKLSGAKPGEAKDIGYQFKPPTQDEMNAADLLQKYTTK